jgi:trehalose synthase
VTSLVIEQFGAPGTSREARGLEFARRRAVYELAGRTVWCATAARAGLAGAEALRVCLGSAGDGSVSSGRMDVALREPLRQLSERLDAMLRGRSTMEPALGPADDEAYDESSARGEGFVAGSVRPGDVVVVHDPLGAALASIFRARGAHVVWRVSFGSNQPTVVEAWRFVQRRRPQVDAYVTSWRPQVQRRFRRGVAAFMSSPDVVSAKEVAPRGSREQRIPDADYDELTWTSLLADVVQADHEEHVGGTLHARPTVAAR